jgi:DNA-binding NarL/FixJ family response regulator
MQVPFLSASFKRPTHHGRQGDDMDTKKKIMIVEDNDLYRAALKELIDAQDHLEVVAEVGRAEEALEIIKRSPADLILLDLRLPGASGYDVLREISPSTDTKVLVLTILESDHSIKAALDAGADGYCFKDVSSKELINAIYRVLAGERYVSQAAGGYPLEQRTEQRQPCECTILWSHFNREHFVPAKMLNCTRSGCYFETAQHLASRSTVLIRIETCVTGAEDKTQGALRSTAVAEVKWSQKCNDVYGVGVRYHFPG